MRQSACLVINPITIDNFAALFYCTPVDRASDSLVASTLSYSFMLVGPGALSSVAWPTGAQLMLFFCFRLAVQGSPTVTKHVVSVESSSWLFIVFKRELFV